MEDDVDSLFEGMVLFTPTQLSDSPPPPPPEPIELPLPPHSHPPPLAAPSPTSAEPLDENLFSDLTLVTPLPVLIENGQEEPKASSSKSIEPGAVNGNSIGSREAAPPSVARQVSRKKKRAAGLRIGYGRHEIEYEPPSHPSTSPSLSPVPIHAVSATPSDVRSKQDTSSVDSVSFQSGRSEQDSSLAFIPAVQADTEPAPSPLTKPEHESVDRGEGDDDPSKDNSDSIEAKFHRVKDEISERLEQARELVAALSMAKKEATRKRRKAAERVNLASARLKELEKSLEEACEAEDFETAERVSESIAGSDKEKEILTNALRDAEAECDGVDEQMQQVLEAQISAEEECVSLLESLTLAASTKSEQIIEKAKLLYEEDMDKWLSSNEALENRKMELEIESHVVNEAREALNGTIEHSTDDGRREKEALCEKKDKLMDELEKLLALVAEKEKEIEENDTKIEAVEKRIAGVVAGFEEAQVNIVENYERLQLNLSEIDMESQALSAKKEEIDESHSMEENKGNKIMEIGARCADEAKAYSEVAGLRKCLISSILKFRENKLGFAKTEAKLSEDVHNLLQEAASARASLQELSSSKSSLQQDIASIEQRMAFIDKRLPELEIEKKVAATARNFKEAARIAAEAKSLSTEKEGMQSEEERNTSDLQKLEQQIEGTVNRLQEIEEQIMLKEKEVAVARIKRLLITACATKAERDAALELGDVEEANLLAAEAEAAESEAKTLYPVYDLKEEELSEIPRHFIPMALVSNLSEINGGEKGKLPQTKPEGCTILKGSICLIYSCASP
ncbi:hypothetical protein SAY87_021889 [Trapa incisa]|uniref:Uncharacterized protein n=1 Tax=Trapa incisa TaxID=236973 RepID=A0AAN7PSJ3_9MYRT|nr:hypothetical protein SAY87_021889 [Trapa incisa]